MPCTAPTNLQQIACGARIQAHSLAGDGSGEHFFNLVVPTGTSAIRADTCLSAFDTKLAVFSGADFCMGTSASLADNDDDSSGLCESYGDESGFNSALESSVTAGQSYMYASPLLHSSSLSLIARRLPTRDRDLVSAAPHLRHILAPLLAAVPFAASSLRASARRTVTTTSRCSAREWRHEKPVHAPIHDCMH
jgi:hypothetical protein